jgi:ubiquinone/menaquinone biosynthesis C-methylase UbiE
MPDVETSSAGYARRFTGTVGRYLLEIQAQAVRSALRGLTPRSALDVGGGHGQLVDPLRELGWSVTVVGTDEVCGCNLHHLHGKRDCEFVRGRLEQLPFENRSFDLVIAVRLISHLANWRGVLRDMCRVANSTVVVDYPSKMALNALTPVMFQVKKSIEGNTRPYRNFSRGELAEQFASEGFRATIEVKQFCLPMALHRLTPAAPLRWAETALRGSGVTRLIGSPVILRADRRLPPRP